MRRAQKETVIGSDLSTLSQDESTECPNIVLKLVTELLLSSRSQELQNLYSVKPNAVDVDSLCQEIDNVPASNLRLDKYSSAVVDDALKRIFQRAKHPILPNSVAAAIDRCGDGLNNAFANQQLSAMPKFNSTVLEFLLKFLRAICVGGGSMRSTQVAASWVPCLFQGPDSRSPARLKFLKLLISNNGLGSPLSPSSKDHISSASPTKSESSEESSGSGETESDSAFSSPEAVRPSSRPPTSTANAPTTIFSNSSVVSTSANGLGHTDGVTELIKECRNVMQAFLMSNENLALRVSEIQAAQAEAAPIASGLGDLRREIDESNEERMQLMRDVGALSQRIAVLEKRNSSAIDSNAGKYLDRDEVQLMIQQALSEYVSKQSLSLNLSGMSEVIRDHSTRLSRVDEDVQSLRSSAPLHAKPQSNSIDERLDSLESRLVTVEHSDAELSRRLHSAVATLDAVEGIVSRNGGVDSSSSSHLRRLEQRLDDEAESRVEIEARLSECESSARSGGDLGKVRKDLERMVAEVRSYTDDVLRVVKEEAKSRVQMDVENCFAPLARDLRAESGRGIGRLEARVGELEFLIRDLKTELHSELKSVAQAMATADANSSRPRARSPGKSEAQVLICEMKTEIDANIMEVRAIADESVRATGRLQNDVARLDGSLVALSTAFSDADSRYSRESSGVSIGDIERVQRSVESMRLRLESDARAIAALEQASATTSDSLKDMKSSLLQLLRRTDANDKKLSGVEGKVRLVEEHSNSSHSSPLQPGISSPALFRTSDKHRVIHSTESTKDSELMKSQIRELESFLSSLDAKFRDLVIRVSKIDDSATERFHNLMSDVEDAVSQVKHEMLTRLDEKVLQLNNVMQDVVAASDEHSGELQQQMKDCNHVIRQTSSALGHRVDELESWRQTLRQSFDLHGSTVRAHDSAVHSSLDSFSSSSLLSSSRGATGDRLHLRSLAKESREDDQSRPVSSRLSTGRSWRSTSNAGDLSSSRGSGLSSSNRFSQRPEQAIDRDLAEVKRLLGV